MFNTIQDVNGNPELGEQALNLLADEDENTGEYLMAGKIWYQIADRGEGEELFATHKEANQSLKRTLAKHEDNGHKVDFEVCGEGGHPLWIVQHEGEVIAKYRLID